MEPNKTFIKIKELGHNNSKREELREFCILKIDQVIKFLSRRILNSDGPDLLDCILNGLPDSLGPKKIKVIDIVLKAMRSESTSLTHCGDVISRVCLEIPRQPAVELVRWCNDSVQSIVDNSDVNMIWRDVLPECLNAVAGLDNIKHCGTDMSGNEYKEQCIRTLCQCKWTEKQLVQLTAMFKDLQLSKADHQQVVNKICSYIMDIPPEALPPLVHQLLKLCKLYNVEIVLSQLSHYFNLHLYSKLEPPPQDSESTTMDIDDIVQHSPAELSRCLSTCIYHISQGAADPELIRKHIKTWPKTQLLRAPFLLDLALAVSDKGVDFRSVCLDAIKSAMDQRAMDEVRSKQSLWVRSVIPPDVDVTSLLKVLTTESANHRQLTVLGLINLAFSLLSVSRLKPSAQACWSHGKLILVRLCKSQPETASHVLSQLADRLSGDVTQRQYTDCLYVLCALSPVSVERCSQMTGILESCRAPGTCHEPAARVLEAVHPLLAFSARIRDSLVMVCRKGLYSRDSVQRRVALSGFLTVLRHLKMSGSSLSGSQSGVDQFSAHSYLTQLTVDLHATQQGQTVTSRVRNEAMCLEVVSILRRCLVQDAAVKDLLYSQFYNCVKDKPALHEPVLEILFEHLSKYLPDEGDNDTLLLDKCVQSTAISAVLSEPISRLIFVIAQFLQPVETEDLEDILCSQNVETGSAHLKSKLSNIMDKLSRSTNLANIDLDSHGLNDLSPESKANNIKVQVLLQCYEALMAHQIMQWNVDSENSANIVYKLFKNSNELFEQIKTPSKLSKKSSKLNMNDTKETTKSQKSQKSQKEKGKGPNKLSNLMKDRTGPFKTLPCVWDLKFCLRILELLYSEEVTWSSKEQRNVIRGRRDFHRWVLKSVLSSIATEGEQKRNRPPQTILQIAALIYNRCLSRFQDICDFDDQTALGCLEVFKSCMSIILSNIHSTKTEALLTNITNSSDPPASIAAILECVHAALTQLEVEGAEEDNDAMGKKILGALCQLATLVLDAPLHSSIELCRAVIKLEEYLRTSKQDCLQLVLPLLNASCRLQQETQLLDDLLLKLASALGMIDEEDTSSAEEITTFPSIDPRTGHSVLSQLCLHLTERFKCAEHLLSRARDLAAAMDHAPSFRHRIETETTELYKALVIELCQLSSWSSRAVRLRCGSGSGSDKALGLCVRLYTLLTSLFKHMPATLAPTLRLERLLKLCGKRFSSVIDSLITYVEQAEEKPRRGTSLKDVRLVPRLVLEAEQFTKHVTLLATKAKVNYQQYLSLGTARDFRIKAPVLQEMLNAMEQPDDIEEADDREINDAATEIIPRASDAEEADGSDEETSRRKRRRAVIKLEEYLRTSKQDCLQLVLPLLNASCRLQQETQLLDDLLLKLASALGMIDEEDTSSAEEITTFPSIDPRTGHSVLSQLCLHLTERFKCAEHLLSRARDLAAAMDHAPSFRHRIETETTELYKALVIELCQLSSWSSRAVRLRCGSGSGSDKALGLCVRLYTLLTSLFKHMPATLAPTLRLERLLKLCGKRFSSVIDSLITYVEQAEQKPRRGTSLKDVRLVPRLVLEAEQFTKHVTLLATKAKVNYQQYLSLGTARDFRIKAPVLQEMLNAMEQPDDIEEADDREINDAATEIIPRASDAEEADGSDEETSRRKRRRVS